MKVFSALLLLLAVNGAHGQTPSPMASEMMTMSPTGATPMPTVAGPTAPLDTPTPVAVPVTPSPTTAGTCQGGIEGIGAGGVVCCALSCGECAGNGCSGRPGGADNCCGGNIKDSGVYCGASGEAPCIIGDEPDGTDVCSDGVTEGIDANGVVCCPLTCGSCAGKGCSGRPGGASDCCGSDILDSDVYCNDAGASAPCILGEAPAGSDTCPDGTVGVEDDNEVVCCPLSCGECAGPGCSGRPGGADDCCGGNIKDSEVMCSTSGTAPCIL
eukprot:g9189.t1